MVRIFYRSWRSTLPAAGSFPFFSGPGRGKEEGASLFAPRKAPAGQEQRRGLILALLVSVMGSVALGLTLVWLNTERTRLALRAHALQREAADRMELNAKLEVERTYLLSPAVLSEKAAALGLRAALPGEIRRLEKEEESNQEGE
jgi:hypothetical protein